MSNFIGYPSVVFCIIIAEAAIIILAFRSRPRLALYVVLVSLYLKGQYLWLGRAFYAWQFAALLGLALVVASKMRIATPKIGRDLSIARGVFFIYFIYSVLISIPLWILFAAQGHGHSGTAVSASRVLSQIVFLMFSVGIYCFGLWGARHISALSMLRAIILIATVAAYGAVMQTLLVHYVGLNPFPIIGSDDQVRSAFIMDKVFRANSFVGEPKHLGILLSLGLMSLYLLRLLRIPVVKRFTFHIPVVMFAALLLSLSTSGIVMMTVGISVLSVIYWNKVRPTEIAAGIVGISIVLTQILWAQGDFASTLQGQIDKAGFEVQDESVKIALTTNPALALTGAGLGNIHLLAVDFLPESFPLFRDAGYKANSGLFYILGDVGILGLAMFVLGPILTLNAFLRLRGSLGPAAQLEGQVCVTLMVLCFFSFLMRFDTAYFFIAGVVLGRLAILRAGSVEVQSSRRLSPVAMRDITAGNG